MFKSALLSSALPIGLTPYASGQSPLEDVETAAQLMNGACVPDSLEFDQLFADALAITKQSGLSVQPGSKIG